MRAIRFLALVVHIASLGAGVLVSIAAAHSVIENMPSDAVDIVGSRFATAAAFALITVSFCFVLAKRGFTALAPVMLVISYALLSVPVDFYSRAIAKDFAPAPPDDLPALYTEASMAMAIGFIVAVAACVWTYRNSRFPLI